ncbi:MAG: type II 3-dehydroquinate dehydratase [Deltaproteobacteria bacterium]|nr:type II 3-dehydroquinate dehydratase [Deltaproteobacteria bacterium]
MISRSLLIIHGPNLNLLGRREPEIYGTQTLEMINQETIRKGRDLGLTLSCRQSNHEGEIIDWLQQAEEQGFSGVIINPAAYTHTSIAIRDAIAAIRLPVIEIHLSNIFSREDFRRKSLTGAVCRGSICGFGPISYQLAVEAFNTILLTDAHHNTANPRL